MNVGSFRLSCNTTQLIIISSAITANSLTYLWLSSNKGISASNQNPIPPTPTARSVAGDIEQHFNIDFASLGFNMEQDILEGQVTLETGASAEDLAKLSKVPSEPLHPAEQEFFARLERGEL